MLTDQKDVEKNFGLDFVLKLKPCSFNWKAPMNDGKIHFGFIAQDVDELAPKSEYGIVTMKEGFYALNYQEFFAPFARAIQEIHENEVKLENKVIELENKLVELENKQKMVDSQPKYYAY